MASRGVNKVVILGNVCNDIEPRYFPDGNCMVNLTVATSETWKDKNTGEQKELTEFHRVVIKNNHLAKICGEYVKKGQQIYLEGKLQTRKWEKDGIERYSTEVVLDFNGVMQMLGSSAGTGSSASTQGSSNGHGGAQQSRAANQPPVDDSFDQDVPF